MGKLISVDQEHPSEEVLQRAEKTLREDGVLVMPTDSVYGIGCAAYAHNPAHERIFSIKKRDRAQTLPWLVAQASDLMIYGKKVPSWAQKLAELYWPGALTLVVWASDAVAKEYQQGNGTIALRCPNSVLVQELCRHCGVPLATTSANTHGQAAATSGESIEDRIVAEADLSLDAGPAPLSIASTIVDCLHGEPRILREGAISSKELFHAIGF